MSFLSAQLLNVAALVSGIKMIPLISAIILIMSRRKRIPDYGQGIAQAS